MQQEQTLNVARSITRKPNPNTGTVPRNPQKALTKRVKAAIEAQVFEGLGRADAAKKAGLTEASFYQALRKPIVLAYWNAQLEVLRTGERARNLHRLTEIREQGDNLNAAVRAVQVLEQAAEGNRAGGTNININIAPGYVIDLSAEDGSRAQVIDNGEQRFVEPERSEAKPLIGRDDVGG